MKVFLLTVLIVCVEFLQGKAETNSQQSNATNLQPSVNTTQSLQSKKGDDYIKLSKNETQENLTISLDYELVPVVSSDQQIGAAPVGAAGPPPPVGAAGPPPPVGVAAASPPVGEPPVSTPCSQKDIDALKKSAYVAKRYSNKKLDEICQRQRNWNDVVVSLHQMLGPPGPRSSFAAAAPPGPSMTEDQRSFIDEVRSCKGKECFESRFQEVKPTGQQGLPGPTGRKGPPGPTGNQTAGAPGSMPVASGVWARVTRKEYRTLTDSERKAFHAALNAIKTKKIDGVSRYNLLIEYHAPAASPAAHYGCSFLPWHREFLKQLEVILRYEDPNVFLPYWDSTLDQALPDPCDSILFSDPFMGASKGKVASGAFSQWKTTRSFDGSNDFHITRACGSNSRGELFEPADIDYYMTKKTYKDLCMCNDAALESGHGLVHLYLGGHMSRTPIAPNDPIFFMHHCFIDYIWEQWRLKNQNRNQRENDYPTGSETCGKDYYADVPMKPFPNKMNKDGLANWYTDDLYQYALRPTCPNTCSGPNLFCSKKFTPPRCLSKVQLGGNCKGFENENICYSGKCVSGKCK